jgi:hypothetical protein
MNDHDWGDRFSRDVDVLLRGGEPRAVDSAPPEYGEMLALTQTLAGLDLSSRSQIRQPLRRSLLAEANRPTRSPRRVSAGRPTWKQVAMLVPLAVVALLAVGLLLPVLQRAWPLGGSSSMGVLALTASPTFGGQMREPSPLLVATPRLAPLASSTPVPAPTAGNTSTAASAALPPVGTRPVARTATGLPTGLPPTSNLR